MAKMPIPSKAKPKEDGSGTPESAVYVRVTLSTLSWGTPLPTAENSIRMLCPTLDAKPKESNVKLLKLTKLPAPGSLGIPEAKTTLVEASNNWML